MPVHVRVFRDPGLATGTSAVPLVRRRLRLHGLGLGAVLIDENEGAGPTAQRVVGRLLGSGPTRFYRLSCEIHAESSGRVRGGKRA